MQRSLQHEAPARKLLDLFNFQSSGLSRVSFRVRKFSHEVSVDHFNVKKNLIVQVSFIPLSVHDKHFFVCRVPAEVENSHQGVPPSTAMG